MKKIGNTTKPDNPLWDEYIDPLTGELSLKEYKPRKISKFDECNHYYDVIDSANIRCKYCGLGHRIVWGYQKVINGKLIDVIKQK
jgi:hypothetical protein